MRILLQVLLFFNVLKLLDLILNTAINSSPSAVNQQAYHFYIVNDKALINEFATKSLESLVSHGFNVGQCKKNKPSKSFTYHQTVDYIK